MEKLAWLRCTEITSSECWSFSIIGHCRCIFYIENFWLLITVQPYELKQKRKKKSRIKTATANNRMAHRAANRAPHSKQEKWKFIAQFTLVSIRLNIKSARRNIIKFKTLCSNYNASAPKYSYALSYRMNRVLSSPILCKRLLSIILIFMCGSMRVVCVCVSYTWHTPVIGVC